MDTVWNGHLVGTFYGYKPGAVYRLSDGSKWRQDDLTDERVYREDPDVRLIHQHDVNTTYLDVDGTSAIVRVLKCAAQPASRVGRCDG